MGARSSIISHARFRKSAAPYLISWPKDDKIHGKYDYQIVKVLKSMQGAHGIYMESPIDAKFYILSNRCFIGDPSNNIIEETELQLTRRILDLIFIH